MAYATGQLDEADREILETHIEGCPDCDSEIADVRLFNAIAALRPPRGPAPTQKAESLWLFPRLKPAYRIPLHIMAMIVIAIFIVRVATGPLSSKADRLTAEVARLRSANDILSAWLAEQSSSGDALTPSRTKQEEEPRAAPAEASISSGNTSGIMLSDGGRTVRLDDKGNIDAEGLIPREYLGLVAAALKSGRLSRAVPLVGRPGGQTRSADEEDPFHLLAPVGVTSMSDRPHFSWTPLADAESYSVEVRDLTTDQETETDKLLKPEWLPEKAFARGHKYSWVVIATLNDGKHVYVPGAGSPSAVFAILPGAALNDLQRAKTSTRDCHLLMAVLYSRQGLTSEAQAELRALTIENPHSGIVEKLRKSLNSRPVAAHTNAAP